MRRITVTLSLLAITLATSGCSAMMAATGSDSPDLSVLRAGTPRKTVQASLGRPTSSIRTGYGDEVTFQYFTGDEPNMRRAAVYAVLTGVTLGLAEVVTAPAEMVQGDRHVVVARFDRNGRLIDYRTTTVTAPIEAPEKIVGLEEELNPDLKKRDKPELLRLDTPGGVQLQKASYQKKR